MSESTTFTYDQLDTWDKTAVESKRVLVAAQAVEQQARDNERRKLLRPAAEQYDQALQDYDSAIKHLEQLVGLNFDHVAIVQLVSEARANLTEATKSRAQLLREQPAKRCRDQIQAAQQLLQEAEQFLRNDELNEARERATQARDLDPTLSELADSVLRVSDTPNTSSAPPIGLIIVGIIVVAFIALAVIFGPGLWAWASEFLFPAALVIKG